MVIMSERIVARYLKHVTDDMLQNNRTEIKCLCRKCRLKTLHDPFSRKLQEHLLMRGFMDGYTRWMSDEDEEGGEDEELPHMMEKTKSHPHMIMEIKMLNNMDKIMRTRRRR